MSTQSNPGLGPGRPLNIEKLLLEIQRLANELEIHKNDKIVSRPEMQATLLARILEVKDQVGRFRKFNAEFFEKFGLTEQEINQTVLRLPKGSPSERMIILSDQIKIKLLKSYAEFLKKAYDASVGSPFFDTEGKRDPKMQKKKLKQKFKSMNERLKWKKM